MHPFVKPAACAALGGLALLALPPAARAQAISAPEPPRRKPAVPGATPVAPAAELPAEPFAVPASSENLARHTVASRPTIFIFTRPSSSLERGFVRQLCGDAGRKAGVGVVSLTTGSEPAARKYEVKDTPTAIVFDRRGRFVSRSSDPEQIRRSLQQALGVMRIDWPEADDPRYEAANQQVGRPVTGGIMRTMAFQPEWLGYINGLARKAHFSPGYLDVRTKEMIAAYVSGLNDCRF